MREQARLKASLEEAWERLEVERERAEKYHEYDLPKEFKNKKTQNNTGPLQIFDMCVPSQFVHCHLTFSINWALCKRFHFDFFYIKVGIINLL